MVETELITLPAGCRADGDRVREVSLRAVSGADELALIDRCAGAMQARRVTELLARCAVSLGPVAIARPAVRGLTVGDREALALHLHALTFGNTLACLAECPNTECGEPLEIELTVDSLLQPPYLAPQLWYETQVDGGRLLRFRLPTGGDQEHVAELAAADLPGAEARLWSLCVDGVAPNERNEALDQRVSRLMEDSDPQAEVAVDMTCPACGANFSAGFDAGGYLVAKLEHRRGELIHQVHLLASHYRWAEADILDLSPPRRLAYVHAIEDELGAAAS